MGKLKITSITYYNNKKKDAQLFKIALHLFLSSSYAFLRLKKNNKNLFSLSVTNISVGKTVSKKNEKLMTIFKKKKIGLPPPLKEGTSV